MRELRVFMISMVPFKSTPAGSVFERGERSPFGGGISVAYQ
jgi:hypothetical protein